jgi:hypothetical protein
MMNSLQKIPTPLTIEEESLLYDEMDKIEQRFAYVLKDLGIPAEALPSLVEMANDMKNP